VKDRPRCDRGMQRSLAEGAVHRVHAADIIQQKLSQPILEVGLQLRKPHAVVGYGIRRDHAKRSGIGYDEHTFPIREGLLG
jgi:hypothetical protein